MPVYSFTKLPGKDEASLSYQCPWCLYDTSSAMQPRSGHQGGESFHHVRCSHAQCGKPALVRVRSQLNWTMVSSQSVAQIEIFPPALPTYPAEGVSSEIARDFTEALRCRATAFFLGAALVGRRVLEAAVRGKGGTGKTLAAAIDSLDPNVLPDPYKKQTHEVRYVGNDAAHAGAITEDEVDDLLGFTSQVLQVMYVMPERLRASIKRRESKKETSKDGVK